MGHIHNMLLCIEMISFINHEHESPFKMILQSVAVISITDLHVMVTCCISLSINIYSSNVLPNSCIGIIIECSFGFAGCIQTGWS